MTVPEPGEVPPDVQALIDAYPRTRAGSTSTLVEILASLPPRLASAGYGRFPVAGAARWSHDWLFPRHVPDFHLHQGTDIFAARGTAVQAPAAGRVRVSNNDVGGLAVTIVQPDGTYWYLAHLADARVTGGEEVVPGTIVGWLGDSGNARNGPPHVHVEVHPHGGPPLDPKPLLDQYYAEALATAPTIIAEYEARARLIADRVEGRCARSATHAKNGERARRAARCRSELGHASAQRSATSRKSRPQS